MWLRTSGRFHLMYYYLLLFIYSFISYYYAINIPVNINSNFFPIKIKRNTVDSNFLVTSEEKF